jgi:hypothetical protein
MEIKIITGCRLSGVKGSNPGLFELLPRTIENMITGGRGQDFEFRLRAIINGRETSVMKKFGTSFIEHEDFQLLSGKILPVSGTQNFKLKFNEDGTIDVVSVEEMPSNEGALPRESTVKQLEKIRKATASTTIDNKIPKMKGGNLGFERNYIDSGIESYEDFQKKNKSFIPGWNLKHLSSPFKKK